MAHEKAVSNQHSAINEKQHQQQGQRPFTAKPLHGADAEDAKEKDQGLPLMTTDHTDLEKGGNYGGRESEFVPVAGGYGFHKVRLKIEPGMGVERSTAQVIVPDICEVHANRG